MTNTLTYTQSSQPVLVPSFVCNDWWAPAETPPGATRVRNAATGETIALVSTAGLDIEAALDYARTVGQRALADFTIHQRAIILKKLAMYLTERKAEFNAVSHLTGATVRDNLIDVDGGIGVLFTLASKARRELPNSNLIIDGATEQLSKDNSFVGEHIYSKIPGVAVQINAFNFPVWGMLEKFAPAFLAGVPTVVKPATPTGYLSESVVRAMVESGLLPDGSISLISGSARDLMDHLDFRDVVAFTGSADTARALENHSSVRTRGLRFNAETDSLNAAILGPDATKDTPEFAAFISSVFVEMTAKAGQKCTSIRRVIVPEALRDDVVQAIGDKISQKLVIGDPRADGVTMGALASLEQRDDVRSKVSSMLASGASLAYGSLDAPRVRTLGGDDAVVEDGAFMSPVVLSWEDAASQSVHEVEAFGPVTSVLTYTTIDDAVTLAARGAGSLVATVCSNDPETVAYVVRSIAGYHGRVLVLNREDARTSTGHGSPVPHLIHGGPGRAGGGEELGGIRSVLHYMQRTAIQGSPNMLTAITGVWHTGAEQHFDVVHPFRKSLDELRIGDAFASDLRTVSLEDISAFANSTGDTFYAHTNEDAAAANPFFPGIVAHGYLQISWAAGLFVEPTPGPVLANYGLENLRFLTPLAAGDAFRVTLTAKKITPREDQDYGEVTWDAVLRNQRDEIVATYDVLTLVAKTQR